METKYYILDIETDKLPDISGSIRKEVLNFQLAVAIEISITSLEVLNRYNFKTHLDLLDFLNVPKNERHVIYCHNLSYDSRYFFMELRDIPNINNVKFIKTNSKFLNIECLRDNSKARRDKDGNLVQEKCLIFKDSLSILLTSVKKLGKMINLPKLELDFSYNDLDKAFEYCYRDCLIVYYSLFDLIKILNDNFDISLDFSNLPLTIASLGYSIFRKVYPNAVHKYRERLERELRPLYFGGRVETSNFNKLKEALYLDFHSLYPFVKCKYDYSLGYVWSINCLINENQVSEMIQLIKNDSRILGFTASINEQNNNIPFLPYRLDNKKVIYPLGIKRNFISKVELIEIIEKNPKIFSILNIERVYLSQEKNNFSNYYATLYKLRMNFPETHYCHYIFKILMNSTYGKDGQKPERENRVMLKTITPKDVKKGNIVITHNIPFRVNTRISKYQNCNLLNAILTCNYARLELYNLIKYSQVNNVKVYYYDTDSIIIDKRDLFIFQDKINDELGMLDIQLDMNNFQAFDSKEYSYESKNEYMLKCKGLTTNLGNFNELKDYKDYVINGALARKIPNPYTLIKNGQDTRTAIIYKRNKRSFYCKRVINSDLTTNPLDLINLDLNKVEQLNKIKILEVL